MTGTSPCTLHVVPGHTEDHRHQGPPGARLRLPVRGRLEGRRRDRGRDPRPRHEPSCPRAPPVASTTDPLPATSGKTTDPAKAKALLKQAGNARATRSSSCSRPTTTRSVAAKDEIVKGLDGGRLQGHPDRLDRRRRSATDAHRPRSADQRPLQRMVLGLADRRLVVPGPVGRQPRRPRGHAQPVQLQGGGRWTPSRTRSWTP